MRIWRIAHLSRDLLGTYLCAGVFTMLLWQVFQNIGMTIKIMPVTGLPMPFISYGGSGLITWFALLGLVQSVHMRRMPVAAARLRTAMTALWARLEPLLAQVQKPARYIGCEDGAVTPARPGKVAWLLVYPDTYEIGLPNQGLQILYEILNERDDAVAERSYAPVDRPRARCSASTASRCSRVDTHRAGRRLRRARVQPRRPS